MIRPLSDEEKWRVMGLNEQKATCLDQLKLSEEKGRLAGNSIPGTMITVVTDIAAHRVARYQHMKEAISSSAPLLAQPTFELQDKYWCVTILVLVGLREQTVVAWQDNTTPCLVSNIDQGAAFKLACSWAADLGYADAQERCVLLERPAGCSSLRAIAYYDVSIPAAAADGARLVKIDSVLASPLGELAVAAMAFVTRTKGEVMVNSAPESAWETGRNSGTAAYQVLGTGDHCNQSSAASAFEEQINKHNAAAERLRCRLMGSENVSVVEWSQNVTPLETSEVPNELRKPLSALEWSGLRFADPHEPVQSEWQPLPARKILPTRDAPQGWLSAVVPAYRAEAARRVRAFTKKMTKWMSGYSERPLSVVIPGSWLEHWVFEAPHDFCSQPGSAVPIDLSTPSKSHLNLDFYAQQGVDYPDQELLSFIVLGVRYKADLPVQIVLQPHLQSFLPVCSGGLLILPTDQRTRYVRIDLFIQRSCMCAVLD